MNTPVNFEIAKLLKEKGFDLPTLVVYVYRGIEHQDKSYKGRLTKDKLLCDISAPTIAEVVMWLYEKHRIHIEILLEEDAPWSKFYYRTMKVGQYFALSHNAIYKDSPTEAYEAGIEYILNNLIKNNL